MANLVYRHHISQPDSKVVPHNLVEADFGLLYSVISKYNAYCVLALFPLQDTFDANEARQTWLLAGPFMDQAP